MFDLKSNNIFVNEIKLSHKSFSRKVFISHNIKLCLIKRGSALWQIEERTVAVKEGDVVILNNHMKRVFKEVSEVTGIELLVVEFEPQLFLNQFRSVLYGRSIEKNNVISGQEELTQHFLKIWEERQKNLPYSEVIIVTQLVEIMVLIMRCFDITVQSYEKMNNDMWRVLEYIDDHYQNEISLQQVARLVNISTTSLSRNFTKCMGIGFAGYIMQKRIQYAIRLLMSSDKTVLEIALESGFNNTASFYKAFKKITNLTPKDYRHRVEGDVMV